MPDGESCPLQFGCDDLFLAAWFGRVFFPPLEVGASVSGFRVIWRPHAVGVVGRRKMSASLINLF